MLSIEAKAEGTGVGESSYKRPAPSTDRPGDGHMSLCSEGKELESVMKLTGKSGWVGDSRSCLYFGSHRSCCLSGTILGAALLASPAGIVVLLLASYPNTQDTPKAPKHRPSSSPPNMHLPRGARRHMQPFTAFLRDPDTLVPMPACARREA